MNQKKTLKYIFRPRHKCKECGVEIPAGHRCSACEAKVHAIIRSGGPQAYALRVSAKVKPQRKMRLNPRLAAKWQAKRERTISGENANAKHAKTQEV